MESFSLALVLHQRDDPLGCHFLDALKSWTCIAILNIDRFWVNLNFGFLMDNGLCKELFLMSSKGDLIFFPRILVLWLQFADLFEG